MVVRVRNFRIVSHCKSFRFLIQMLNLVRGIFEIFFIEIAQNFNFFKKKKLNLKCATLSVMFRNLSLKKCQHCNIDVFKSRHEDVPEAFYVVVVEENFSLSIQQHCYDSFENSSLFSEFQAEFFFGAALFACCLFLRCCS